MDVHTVAWDDDDAAALRAEMAAEVGPRYLDRIPITLRDNVNAVDAAQVHATFVVRDRDRRPAGHAAVRWNAGELELKRMYVRPQYRGTGVAELLLAGAESAARSAGLPRLILQTGDRQPDAVRFYERNGYGRIPAFPPYDALPYSRCYAKYLDRGLRRWLRLQLDFLSTPAGVRSATAWAG